MNEDEKDFDSLIQTALDNAKLDRDHALDAFEKTKAIYNINLEAEGEEGNSSNLQGLMLIGQNVSKLLEISQKSNEQIIKLAQLKKGKTSAKDADDSPKPYDLESLRRAMT